MTECIINDSTKQISEPVCVKRSSIMVMANIPQMYVVSAKQCGDLRIYNPINPDKGVKEYFLSKA